MYCFFAAQKSDSEYSEITGTFFTLRANETKVTGKNAFNPDHPWMDGKDESKTGG